MPLPPQHMPALAGESTYDRVLRHFDNPKRTRDGYRVSCPSGLHANGDRDPSLYLSEGRDGRVLGKCFSVGCSVEEWTRGAGLEVRDLFPRPLAHVRQKPNGDLHSPPHKIPEELALLLYKRAEFPMEWAVAKVLAQLPRALQRQDILQSWDYLSDRVDIPLVWELAGLLRGAAFLRYCDAKHCDDTHKAEAVARMVKKIEGPR